MNYLAEIKAFYDRLELSPQPNTVIALWHALMSIANKAGWPDTFTVAQSVLGLRSGLNASALKRARNKLATDGFIEWKQRGGNQSAQYRILSLVVQNQCKSEPQFAPQCEPQSEPQFAPQCEPINKTKTKTKTYIPPISPVERFSDFFSAYPKQKNLIAAEKEYNLLLFNDQNLTEQELIIAAENYTDAVSILGTDEQYIKNPDRFLKDGTYLDYLDANYKKPKAPTKKNSNKFNEFEQNEYDFAALEKELLSN